MQRIWLLDELALNQRLPDAEYTTAAFAVIRGDFERLVPQSVS